MRFFVEEGVSGSARVNFAEFSTQFQSIETAIGTERSDWLHAGGNVTTLYGGDNIDHLYSEAGVANLLDGGNGADNFYLAGGDDEVVGGQGQDVLWLTSAQSGVTANFGTAGSIDLGAAFGIGTQTTITLSSIEVVRGSNYDDVLHAGGDQVKLIGNDGNDDLHGNEQDNDLSGNYGDDLLLGYDGPNTFNWEAGDDSYEIRFGLQNNVTTKIVDFGGTDSLHLVNSEGVESLEDVWFKKGGASGSHLDIIFRRDNYYQTVEVTSYFADATIGIDEVTLEGIDKKLSRANIDLLVSYMAGHAEFDIGGDTGNGKTVQDRINELWIAPAA
ncbi:calcium-binding protein [Curvivirga aplysinae]|uniref:calcium-binding protein n=1 Tax=Curvivirga aplysinae TaxID=2529852 RepID=UPI0012BC2405|nr:calcium-binding protein [Curvivirga aplysinae]MTI10399.1 calcium-binding protein [Curvivirga aplysinae]